MEIPQLVVLYGIWISFYYLVHYPFSTWLSRRYFSKYYGKFTPGETAEWANRITSSIHCCISALGAMYFLGFREQPSDLVFGTPKGIHGFYLFAGSASFFMVDLVIITWWWNQMGGFGFVAHHIGAILPLALGTYYEQMHFYGLWILTTEISTPFVNTRWMIATWAKYDKSKDYGDLELKNGIGMWISFLIFRVINVPFLLWHYYQNFNEIRKGNILVWGTMISGTALVLCLSSFWFFKITQGIIKKVKSRSKPKLQ